MCPICKKVIPLKEKNKISEAHIIPKVAGGKLKTFLCRECNSKLGSKQDKWFGEYTRIQNQVPPTMFSTKIKEGFFEIDDDKLQGDWTFDKDKGFNIFIDKKRNPPNKHQQFINKFKSKIPKVVFSVELPLLKNEKMIHIGFLTAAYLMWFRAFGYSWVMQSHLDIIREQILNPEKNILKGKFFSFQKASLSKPLIGIAKLFDEIVLIMLFLKSVIFLPPIDRPEIYSNLDKIIKTVDKTGQNMIKISDLPKYGPPMVVMLDNRCLIIPDDILNSRLKDFIVLFYSSESSRAEILYPVKKETSEKLKKDPNIKSFKVDLRHLFKIK